VENQWDWEVSLKTILTLLAVVVAFVFAFYSYAGLLRFMNKFKEDAQFLDEHYFKFLAVGAFAVWAFVFLGQGVSAFFTISLAFAAAFAFFEYLSKQKEEQLQQERVAEARNLRELTLRSGEGWTKQDVLNKFRTTLFYRRYGKLTTTTGWRCAGCSKNLYVERDAEIDHILPRSKYPNLAMTEGNLQILCRSCNAHKHAYEGDDWKKTVHKRRRAKNKKRDSADNRT
jgi:5-methylcytosine-specific restriction endonuclease McrA